MIAIVIKKHEKANSLENDKKKKIKMSADENKNVTHTANQ